MTTFFERDFHDSMITLDAIDYESLPCEIQPMSLHFELKDSVDNLQTVCNDVCLEISIGFNNEPHDNNIIHIIPLHFCLAFFNNQTEDNVINIPFHFLGNYFPLHAMRYVYLQFKITNNPFDSCKLMFQGNNSNIKDIEQYSKLNSLEYLTQHLSSYNVEPMQPIYKQFHTNLNFYELHKGIFIETDSIANIETITLTVNGRDVIKYLKHDTHLYQCKYKQINDKLIYISYDNEKYFHYDEMELNKKSCIDFNYVDFCKIKISCFTPFAYIRLYGLSINIARSLSNCFGYAYNNRDIFYKRLQEDYCYNEINDDRPYNELTDR